jgi:hypothetical protein
LKDISSIFQLLKVSADNNHIVNHHLTFISLRIFINNFLSKILELFTVFSSQKISQISFILISSFLLLFFILSLVSSFIIFLLFNLSFSISSLFTISLSVSSIFSDILSSVFVVSFSKEIQIVDFISACFGFIIFNVQIKKVVFSSREFLVFE